MIKSTLFIAVKCCHCSTMQVKQQKKSSNKWNCVVCNQKQSVTKIYAQGYQAKDIRNVVQSFNMSRKFDDEKLQQQVHSFEHFVEHLEGSHETGDCSNNNSNSNDRKRRTDWSDYMEDYDNVELEPAYLKSKLNEKEMEAEIEVVTELPEGLGVKKPRSKGITSLGSSMNRSYKPNFSKRASTKEVKEFGSCSSSIVSRWDECIADDSYLIVDVRRRNCEQQQKLQNKVLTTMKTGGSKLPQYTAKDDFHRDNGRQSERKQQQQDKCMATMEASVSKWSVYITEDDNNGDERKLRASAFADDLRLVCGFEPKNDGIDQLIEEEIHPDFM